MRLSNPLLWAGLTAAATNAYKLQFFNSATSICGGQSLGVWTGGPDAKCSTEYAGLATQVLITSDSDSDKDNTVIFFKGDDCDSANVIGQGQTGCIEIGGENAKPFDSFTVVKGSIGDETRKRAHERAVKEARVAEVKRTADAHQIPAHGEFFNHDNQTWRWHKLSARTWSGVLHDEWDDDTHVENNLADLDDDSQQSELDQRDTEISGLLVRDDASLSCRVSAWCAATATSVGTGIREYGGKLVDKAADAAAKRGQDLFRFLNTPFGASIASTVGTGVIIFGSIYVNNRWSPGKSKVEECVSSSKQEDVVKLGIDQLTKLTDMEAAQMVIDLKNGEIQKISISTSKKGEKDKCGAPAPKDNLR